MFTRPARSGVLLNLTDNFIHLARLVRVDEKPQVVDSFVELRPTDDDAITRWLEEHFPDRGVSGYLPGYCGFHPAARVLVRETINTRRLVEPAYLQTLLAEHAKLSSAKEWQAFALHPSDGLPLPADGSSRAGLLFGLPWAAIRDQQQRLLKLGIRPRRLEAGTLALLGSLSRHLTQAALAHAVVVCEIEYAETRAYVLTKDGVHTLSTLPHGLLSIEEAAMKELGAPDIAVTRRQLEEPTESLREHNRRLVRVLSRHLKPAIDFFELKTGHRIDTLYCAHLPAKLDWLGSALGTAVDLEMLLPNLDAWLPNSGLSVVPGAAPLNPGWLPTLGLVSQLSPVTAPAASPS